MRLSCRLSLLRRRCCRRLGCWLLGLRSGGAHTLGLRCQRLGLLGWLLLSSLGCWLLLGLLLGLLLLGLLLGRRHHQAWAAVGSSGGRLRWPGRPSLQLTSGPS